MLTINRILKTNGVTGERSRYGSMMLKGLTPVIGNWFIFSIISVSSSALPSTLTACATVS